MIDSKLSEILQSDKILSQDVAMYILKSTSLSSKI